MFSTGNTAVDSLSAVNFSGNVIPAQWYRTITKDNGKAHLLAIVILADIVYWYRPTEVRDENTGQMLGYKKKFQADLLQRSYEAIADQVGEEKRTVKRAIKVLTNLGVIRLEFRTITCNGKKINNVMFIDLDVAKLFDITYPKTDTPMTKNCNRVVQKIVTPCSKKLSQPMTKNCKTNTKNTYTEITTKINSSSSKSVNHLETVTTGGNDEEEEYNKIKNQIDYKKLAQQFGHVVDLLISSILDLPSDKRGKVTPEIAYQVCKTFKDNQQRVVIPIKYISTCLSSMLDGGIPPDKIKPFIKPNEWNSGMLLHSDIDFEAFEKNILSN